MRTGCRDTGGTGARSLGGDQGEEREPKLRGSRPVGSADGDMPTGLRRYSDARGRSPSPKAKKACHLKAREDASVAAILQPHRAYHVRFLSIKSDFFFFFIFQVHCHYLSVAFVTSLLDLCKCLLTSVLSLSSFTLSKIQILQGLTSSTLVQGSNG